METLNESIKYPLYTVNKGWPKMHLAGSTCDSVDTLYEFQYNCR